MLKAKVLHLGKKVDMETRARDVRIDNMELQNDIARARRWMFQRGRSIKHNHMADVLGPCSLTPTRVFTSFVVALALMSYYTAYRTPSQNASPATDSTITICISLT